MIDKEKVAAKHRRYRQSHAAACVDYQRRYRKLNIDKVRTYGRMSKRRSRARERLEDLASNSFGDEGVSHGVR